MTLARACSAAVINWGLLVLILYALYYTALEPVAGASWGALLGIPMWLTATAFYQHVPHAWAWALGLHILSWFAQVGHAPLACPSQLCASAFVPACECSYTLWPETVSRWPKGRACQERMGATVHFCAGRSRAYLD